MKARWYQEEALDALFDYLSTQPGNPILALPTGTGKSFIIAEFIRRVMQHYPAQRFLMLTHVKELIVQNAQELLAVWPTAPLGVYSAGAKRREHNMPITFAGIASAVNKASLFRHIDLVFIDECHLVSPKGLTMYRTLLAELAKYNPRLRVIGLTATNWRLGLGMLTDGGVFNATCYDLTTPASFNRLIADGFLAPLIPKRTALQYDLRAVKTDKGDYNLSSLQGALDVEALTLAAVRETIEQGQNRKHWLIFASGIEHAEHIAATFSSLGVSAALVHSKMPDRQRDAELEAFKAGRYRCLVNNTMFTTGFNFPALDLISIMSATKSSSKWVQILGRGTRPCDGKENCLILDYGGNTVRLGEINNPVIPGKKGTGGGMAPVKVCPSCMTYNPASIGHCAYCGAEFPHAPLKLAQAASTKELIKEALPVVEPFKVDRVTYSLHHPFASKSPSLLVSYYCGLRLFKEWVCLQHPGPIRGKATRWWRDRSKHAPPATIEAALLLVSDLIEPKQIKVWINKIHPEVINYDF